MTSTITGTCVDDIIVLRANMVALSLTVDWLSNAPWVSNSKMATWWEVVCVCVGGGGGGDH